MFQVEFYLWQWKPGDGLSEKEKFSNKTDQYSNIDVNTYKLSKLLNFY